MELNRDGNGGHTIRSAHEQPDEDDEYGNEDEDVSPSQTLKGSPAQRFFDDDDNDERSTVKKRVKAPPKKKTETHSTQRLI